MDKLTLLTTVAPGRSLLDLYLLLASIREFGGELADAPIRICIPKNQLKLPDQVWDHYQQLGAGLLEFQADEQAQGFPFGTRVQAAAEAERALANKTELLAWLDSDTLVLHEPAELTLDAGKVLGYRPVHHRLLGTSWGEELDPFWDLVYHKCRAIPQPGVFMITHTGQKIRPYFNAGCFVVRPEAGLLQRWWQAFRDLYRSPDFLPFYEKDPLYPVFMHQAIFTGVLLAAVEQAQRQEFSSRINYPLHLHGDIPAQLRAKSINDLITVRCESLLSGPEWQRLPIQEPLSSWLEGQLAQVRDWKEKS